MRAVGHVALGLIIVLVAAGIPVEAKPFPQTQQAVRMLVRETMQDADRTAADAALAAAQMVRGLRGAAEGLSPVVVRNGAVEVRAAAAQPVVRGEEDFLSVGWIAAKDEMPWTGVYWIEANGMARSPNVVTLDAEGALLFLDRGALALPDAVDITYHLMGVDGARVSHHVGVSRVLGLAPIEDRAELGMAVASDSGHMPEAIVLTAWNTLGRDATIGVTFYAGDAAVEEFVVADCDQHDATVTSAGCRLLYVSMMPDGFSGLALWHLEGDERVEDLTLTRAELLTGYSSPL